MAWITGAAGLLAWGPRQRREFSRQLAAVRAHLEQFAPSATIVDDAWHRGGVFPAPGTKLSRSTPRLGEGLPHRRWTSPLAVDLEDRLDAMTPAQADAYDYPASPSAVMIARAGYRLHRGDIDQPLLTLGRPGQKRRDPAPPPPSTEPTCEPSQPTSHLLDALADHAARRLDQA